MGLKTTCKAICLVASPSILGPNWFAQAATIVHKVLIQGNFRSDDEWITKYLSLKTPFVVTPQTLYEFRQKLLTTGVFTSVDIQILTGQENILTIYLEEKWTTIPVLRWQSGGGTPLKIIGGYDIHSFGKLWTLGAEFRQYGRAPAGFVAFARAPRWQGGRYFLGSEVWKEFRHRVIYNEKDEALGKFRTDVVKGRAMVMAPFNVNGLQWGLDLWMRGIAPAEFEPNEGKEAPKSLELIKVSNKRRRQLWLLPTIIFDNVLIDNIIYDGFRMITKFGTIRDDSKSFSLLEWESFFYKRLFTDLNLAAHFFVAQSDSTYLEAHKFLGGFDSIRGIPDGAIFGNHAYYANLEIREILIKVKYLWLQGVAFYDLGGGANTFKGAQKAERSTMGLGLRFSVPQVYRMVFRVDVAQSLDENGTTGFSFGLNQFFQPYRPL